MGQDTAFESDTPPVISGGRLAASEHLSQEFQELELARGKRNRHHQDDDSRSFEPKYGASSYKGAPVEWYPDNQTGRMNWRFQTVYRDGNACYYYHGGSGKPILDCRGPNGYYFSK
jgi:hypothetical protein